MALIAHCDNQLGRLLDHLEATGGMAATMMAQGLGVPPQDARLFMAFDGRFKMMHAEGGFRPMLFDLDTDPAHEATRRRLYQALARWARRQSQRTTIPDETIPNMRGKSRRKGILLGVWDKDKLTDPEVRAAVEVPTGDPG